MLRLTGPAGEVSRVPIVLGRPTMSSAELLAAVLGTLESRGVQHAALALELEVTGMRAPDSAHLDLFSQVPATASATPGSARRVPSVATGPTPARPHIPARRIKRTRRRKVRAQQSLQLFDQ